MRKSCKTEIKSRNISFRKSKEDNHPLKLIVISLIAAGLLTGCLSNLEERKWEEQESTPTVDLILLPPVEENTPKPMVQPPTPVVEIEEMVAIPQKQYTVYNVDLSVELQNYTQDICEEYGVSYPLAIAIMYHESRFQPDVVSNTGDYGIMQINKCNHAWLEKELGITDWFDPYQNIKAGVYILSLNSQYGDLHKVVMCYNYGPTGAKKCWDKGIYSSEYSRTVMNTIDSLEVV